MTVEATSAPQITSDVSNTSVANATGKPGTRALSLGAVLSLNKVSDKAEAFVRESAPGFSHPVAGGGVAVHAADNAGIHSTITLDTDVTLTAGAGGKGGTTPASNATGVAGEAPVMALRTLESKDYDGGAGVIALHLAGLGAAPTLITALADDQLCEQIDLRLRGRCLKLPQLPLRRACGSYSSSLFVHQLPISKSVAAY